MKKKSNGNGNGTYSKQKCNKPDVSNQNQGRKGFSETDGNVKQEIMASTEQNNNGIDNGNNNNNGSVPQMESKVTTAQDAIAEWNNRVLFRKQFRDNNQSVSYEEFESRVKGRKLDSSLKRCTAFVRRMKQFVDLHSQRTTIESELNLLNLTKYISEITLVIVDLRLKLSDIPSVISVCSELHKRYRDFSEHLMQSFKQALSTKEQTASAINANKVSSDIRLFVELFLGGILPKDQSRDFLISWLQQMVSLDKEGSQLIVPFTNLLRDLTDELVGIIPKELRLLVKDRLSELKRSDVLPTQVKLQIKTIFRQYFALVKANIVKKNGEVLGSEKYNRRLRLTRGEISADRKEEHDELAARFQKYHNNASKFGHLLDLSLPKLRKLPRDPEDEFEKALLMTEDGELLTEVPGIVLFEDEETRQFYQDLPDLKSRLIEMKQGGFPKASVPAQGSSPDDSDLSSGSSNEDSDSDYEDSSASESNFDPDLEKAELQLVGESEEIPKELDGDMPPSMREETEAEEVYLSHYAKSMREKFLAFLDSLRKCANRAMIDKAAFEYVENFKNKRSRKDLVRCFSSVYRERGDLIRLLSRLIASLSTVYPDIGTEICELLRKDFRYHVLKRDQRRLESKLKVTRFIAELTNFSIFSKSEAFYCLKMLLRNFIHHQIEMACCFIETCGRFLYRNYDSHRRMKLYMEEMLRRKSAQCLEPRFVYMVDCAYYQICPSPGSSAPKKTKTPLQAFLEFILCYDLNKNTLERAAKVLRMHDWNCPEKFNLVVKILSSPWKFSYVQLDTAAALLASVKQFRPSVAQAVVEHISEGIRMGCEYEVEDINNIRMSTCQYIANLYKYKVISTTSLLNVMYYLISYGVTYNNNEFTKMDPPDSLYRVRLISEVLKIAGDYLAGTKLQRRLDFFLKYFQRYYLYKRNLPMWDVWRFPHFVTEFFEDVIKHIRKNWKFVTTVSEANSEIAELNEKLRAKAKSSKLKRVIETETMCVRIPVEIEPKHKLKPSYNKAVNRRGKQAKINAVHRKVQNLIEEAQKQSNNRQIVCRNEEKVLPPVEEDDFEEAFETMCSEMMAQTAELANTWQKSVDIPLPKVSSEDSGMAALNYGLSTVKVTVLTKENNKPRGKTVEVRNGEDFLVDIKRREDQEKLEKLEVKRRILELTELQEEEEQKERQNELQDLLSRLLLPPKRK